MMFETELATRGIWVITTYFNPQNYRRRRENYHIFREQLAAPLMTVELSYSSEFELGAGDADRLVQLQADDVMWQKERLLNIALKKLPKACDIVAWVDCDVLFASPTWQDDARSALQKAPVVQLFDQVHHLPKNHDDLSSWNDAAILSQPSLAFSISEGQSRQDCWRQTMTRGPGTPSAGFAWAAQRALLERHGFYDLGIVGGGDKALACALFGDIDEVIRLHQLNGFQQACYRDWAEPFSKTTAGLLGRVKGEIGHLWHGDLEHRQSRQRHTDLKAFEFNPMADIALSENGCWRWASDKPDLHRYVREYFAQRREDG